MSLFWARSIQFMPPSPHTPPWRVILLLFSHVPLGLQSGLFPSDLPTENLCAPLLCPVRATCPIHLILFYFNVVLFTLIYTGWRELYFMYTVYGLLFLVWTVYGLRKRRCIPYWLHMWQTTGHAHKQIIHISLILWFLRVTVFYAVYTRHQIACRMIFV